MTHLHSEVRIPKDILKKINEIADKKQKHHIDLVHSILLDYIKQYEIEEHRKATKRRFKRCCVEIPAMIYSKDDGFQWKYDSAKMVDISLCGLRLSFPAEKGNNLSIAMKDKTFEIIFSIGEQDYPIYIKCRTERIISNCENFDIGASFTNCDPQSLAELRKHFASQAL